MADTIMPVTTKVDKSDDDRPASRLNKVDRLITFFSPSYGIKAMVNRSLLNQFGYNDSPTSRGKSPPIRGSESWIYNRDRLKMMADARDAAMYDWIGGALEKIVLYVVGRLHCRSTTGDEGVNGAYDDYFHGWCGDERSEDGTTRCDFSGRHRFIKQIQMAFLAFLVDGDHGLVEVEPSYDENTGEILREFSLQNVEADRIGSPIDATTDEYYIGGVTIDPETGGILTFTVYRRTRAGQYVDPQPVPAASFIHVVDQDRCDEYRGRTKLLRLLNDLRDIRETIDAEKAAGKIQSQFAAFFYSKDPYKGTGPGAWTGQTKEGIPTMDALYGRILKMGEGDSVTMATPSSRPSGAQIALWQMLIRKMATSLKLPYGFLWDLVTLGGVTARIEVQAALRQIQYWQDNVIEALILHRVRQKVLAQGIYQQLIPPHPNWKSCEWHFGPWITTDAGYEMDSDILGITHGITPIAEVTAKNGRTPREVFESNADSANEAITVGAERGLPVETFAPGLFPNITNQKASMIAGPPPPPEPGSIELIGDKGVKALLQLLEDVKTRKMDRESALSTLVSVFGYTRRGADKICPQEPTEEELAHDVKIAKAAAPKPVTGSNTPARKTTAKKKAKTRK